MPAAAARTCTRGLLAAAGVCGFCSKFAAVSHSRAAARFFFNHDGRRDGRDAFVLRWFHIFPQSVSIVTQILTTENYDAVVSDKNKDVLVLIYAPWCGKSRTVSKSMQVKGVLRDF